MKKIYLLFILSIFSLNLYCQTPWTKYPGNPVMLQGAAGTWDEGNVMVGSVIYHNNIYHMWYNGYIGGGSYLNNLIGHATSPDGITWTKDPSNPVLTVGSPGSWDETLVILYGGCVIVINNTFHMWYTGAMGGLNNYGWFTGHATSPDGITWTKDPNNPVLSSGGYGTWDVGAAISGSVLYDGTKYNIWYFSLDGTNIKIGHATSPDGLTWTKDPSNPVLTIGSPGSWDIPRVENPSVIYDGTTYHMWYNGGASSNSKIGYAKSVDGSTWMKYPSNPVMTWQTESWDSKRLWIHSVMDSSGVKYKMWYTGGIAYEKANIGYAESDARIPYLFVKNKMFVDKTDTLVAEINKDGIIYIVPEGTSLVVDSINKYKVASVDTLANAEVHIPLKNLSYGQYRVVAVSNGEFVSPDPFLLRVVPDANIPVLTLAQDTVISGDPISVTSTKDGMLYLLTSAVPPDISMLRNPNFLVDSLSAAVNVPGEFSTTGLNVNNKYYLYVVDIYGMFSERGTVSVEPLVGVKENTNEGIRIYPNPANDLLTIETDNTGQHSIEITSINGQLIYSTIVDGNYKQIDLSTFHKGVYFITVRSKDFVRTEKIIRL